MASASNNGFTVWARAPVPEIHTPGLEGEYPLLVMELDDTLQNVILVGGESPYDHYIGMYLPEILRYDRYGPEAKPQQGGVLVENLLESILFRGLWRHYSTSTTLYLNLGWNLVGFGPNLENGDISVVFDGNQSKIDYIYEYNSSTQTYNYWIGGLPEESQTLTTITENMGYWVKTNEVFNQVVTYSGYAAP